MELTVGSDPIVDSTMSVTWMVLLILSKSAVLFSSRMLGRLVREEHNVGHHKCAKTCQRQRQALPEAVHPSLVSTYVGVVRDVLALADGATVGGGLREALR